MRPHSCEHCGEEGPYSGNGTRSSAHMSQISCDSALTAASETNSHEKTLASYKLKKEISTMKTELKAERQHVSDLDEYLHHLESETQAKTKRIEGLEKDVEAKAERIQDLENIITTKTDQLHELESNNKGMEQRICEYQRETKDKRQHIHELQKDNTAMTQYIQQLESKANSRERQKHDRKRATMAQHVAQLTAENSEKQKKIKQMKKFMVFALGITVLFRLHPLYLIPLLILGTVVYA